MVRDPGRVSDRPADARVGEAPPNFLITDDFALGEGTDGQKLEANLAALRLVKTLEAENRFATAEEQSILARWVGWGGLKTLFDEKHAGTSSQWGRAQAELKSLLTKTQYFDAMRSTADAHYTSRTVVEAMWQAMRNFGFTGGRALEPTIGSGNFLGLQPGDLSGATDWYASELDPITGLIAKHLYPRATVFDGTGFQDAPFRRATFDIAIGNPPFGGDSSRVSNKDMHPDLGRMKVHNFVIAKTGQLLREGGIMGMVVTHRFLDAMDAEARDTLAPNFHFLGAIRLPNTAFKANAGTEVTTDIVFFQKRRAGDEQGDTSWLDTGSKGPNGTRMNAWFAANPDMILGRPAMDGTMYAAGRGENEFTVHDDGRDLAEALAEAVGKIKATLPPREQALEAAVTAPRTVATLGYSEMMLTDDGRIFRGEVGEDGAAKVEEITEKTFWRDNAEAQFNLVEALRPFVGETASPGPDATQEVRNAASAVGLIDLAGDPVQAATKFEQALADAIPALLFGNPSAEHIAAYEAYAKRVEAKRLGTDGFDRLSGILSIRGQVKSLIRAEREGDPAMEQMRAKLRKDYRAFKSAFGYLNNSKNEAILQGDVGPEMALEVKYKAANRDGRAEAAEEAPILSKRVIYPHKIPDRVDGVPDAIHVSMQEKGALDPDLISSLTGKSVPEVIAELTAGEKPLAFKNPATGNFEMAEVYLSGNLAEKIEKAKQARAYDHIPHLKAAMPPPKTKEQITASIRSMWIPPDVFEDFLRAMGYQNPSVSIMEKVGMSAVEYIGTASSEFGQQFTTDRIDAGQVFEAALRGKIPVIYDTFRDASGEKRVKNEEATKEAVAAYERMSAEFPEWAYANPIRAARIVDAFNEKVNVVTPRKYEGTRYLRTVGTSPLVELRNSQKNGAWRMIQDKVTLLHHVVGAGKAQPLDAKVLTPRGWARMGDLEVGSEVIAQDGTVTRVTGVFPQGEKPIYRVDMSDGSATECCDDHLWFTQTYRERGYAQRGARLGKAWLCGQGKVRPLSEIRKTLRSDHLKALNHSIPVADPAQFEPQETPINPWLLGVLIGDGSFRNRSITISSVDQDILNRVSAALPEGCSLNHISRCDYRIGASDLAARCAVGGQFTVSHPLRKEIIDLGLDNKFSYEKRVPQTYLFNSIGVRLEVLRGLMDTDGTVNRSGTHVSFCTTSPGLADDVEFLVRSLGGISRRTTKAVAGRRLAFTITLTMPADTNPFWLARKASLVKPKSRYAPARYITSVEPVGVKQAQCISISHPSRLYVTDDFIVTHNTMTGITGVMERKRMGLTRKAVVVVPNHLTGQWGKEWLELYPAANILVPTEKDFDPANRSKLINRIATGDFDAVIIGHSQMVKIDNDQEIVTRYIEEELDALNDVLQQQKKAKESRRTVAQIGNRIAKLKEKLSRLNDDLEKRRGAGLLSWRELGVDYLVLDEAQEFKNLEYATSATQLVGMNDPNGSQKAFDLLMKIRSLQDIPNGGVAFMTGTPISNSLVEIYSVMKYLIPDSLDAMGIKHFDAWKAAFIQDESRFEYTASMQLKERNVMAGMVNLGPLAELYRSFADIVMRPDVERMYREQMEAKNKAQADASKHVSTRFPTPKVKTGKRRILLAKPTERMEEFTRYLVMRMAGIKNATNKKEYASTDNPLWVLTDARKASVDIRTIDPEIGREEGSKVTRSAAEIYRIWKANTSRNGTQLVFSDMSTPSKTAEKAAKAILKEGYAKIGLKKDDLKRRIARDEAKTFAARWADLVGDIEDIVSSPATSDERRDALRLWSETPAVQDAAAAMLTADTGFSFYDDLKAMLVEKGIPEREIAFIHDFDTTAKKKELFEAVNDGKVRVLIGSTMKMGAGTNAQKRLVALHHIDAPWRPSDMEQREGRIIRQGNLFYEQDPEGFEVEILAYSTEKTADVVQWQVLERKAKAIETFLGAAADTLQEEGGDADQYAEFMAQSTGKKVFLQKMQVEKDLIKARGAIASALRSRSEAKRFVEGFDAEQDHLSARAAAFSAVDVGIFPDGATDYLSEWTGQIEAYRAARDAAEAEADAVRKRNAGKPRKEWERLPEQPNAPQRWQERPSNAWEAKVYDALKRGHDRPGTSPQTIALGKGFSIEIRTSTPGDGGGLVTYTAHLVPPGGIKGADIMLTEWPGVSAKEFRKSDKLLAAFDPAGIIYRAEERAKTAAARIVQHRDMLPQMQEVLAKPVDETAVTDLQTRLSALSAEARIEEVKYAEETASAGSNHFAEIDTKGRNLGAATDEKPLTGQFQFKSGGRSYASEWGAPAGRRRITGTDIFGEVAYFEAEDTDSGERAIVEAIRPPQQKDGPEQAWTVENVFSYATDGGELEMRDIALEGWGEVEADPPITEADIMAITREMNAEIERTGISGKVNVRVVRELYSRSTGQRIYGRMDQVGHRRGEVSIEARGRDRDGVDTIGVMRHEIIHALRAEGLWNRKGGLFTEAEWSALAAAARAEPGIVKSVAERYPHLDQPKRVEEQIAELYRLWMDNRDGYSSVERAFLKVEGFLQALANLFRGKGFVSAARIMDQIATGKIGGRGPQPGGGLGLDRARKAVQARSNLQKTQRSQPAEMIGGALPRAVPSKFKGLIGSKHWKEPGKFLSDLLTDAMGRNAKFNVLSLVPGDPLFTELGKNLSSAQEYVGLKRDMDADRNKWQARAAGVVDKWTKAARRNPTANAALMDLMHESTLAGIDPSLDEGWKRAVDAEADRVNSSDTRFRQEWASDVKAERAGRQDMHFTLRQKLEALPKEFRDLYSEIRSEYSAMADAMDTALVENIKAQSRITIKKADREHKKELARIRDEGLEGQARMDAIGKANEKRSKAHARAARGEGSRVKQLRELFEKNRLQGPYFPLARFGNYFVTIRDADGRVVSFSRFETAGEQKAWAESEEAKDLGQVKTGVLGTSETDRKDVDPRFIADIEGILEEAGADRKTMDMVYQRWLETLPDQSIRTAQIHRKGRAGFNRDAIRAFSSAMFHGAHQTARLRFGAEMEESLDAAEEEAREAADPNREGFIVREMKQRHAFTMQPTNNPWVSKATGLAFVWYLGMSPAAAMVNLSQTTVVGVPMMAAKYRKAGVTGSIRALTRASRDFMRGQGKNRTDTWSAENAKTLTADERRAMKQGYDRGVIDKTQAHDLASVADSGVEYNPVREKVMRIIGFAFHHAERFNREVTYLAAYRLAREEGMSHDVAVSSAASMVWRTHFDYSNTSKPRAMQGDTAKVFLIFRNFQVNMLWRLFRDTHQSLRGATTEERAEARAQLIGITLSMMGHAGIRGVWGYGLIMGLLSLFFPGDSDDLDEWLQDALLMEGDDPLTASWNFLMGMALNGVPGHALGVDLTNRIGMPELWFRAPDKDLEGKDLWAFYLEQLAGPFFGIAGNMFTGASQIMDGQFLRGAEKMVPTFVRNTIKTGRYATEGVTTYYGDDLVDGLNPWQLLMQLSGFSPAEVAEQYEINNRLKRREKRIEDERKDLHRAATDALRDGSGVPASVMEKIRDFNRRHPEYPITGDTIKKSLHGRLRASARNESGVSLNPKLNDRLRGELAPSIY